MVLLETAHNEVRRDTTTLIDTDRDPYRSSKWSLIEHRKLGIITWDKERQAQALYYSRNQKLKPKEGKPPKATEGHQLRKELEQLPVLNANVLDHLLEHQELIPDTWRKLVVYFWGTLFYGQDEKDIIVRCLGYQDGKFHDNREWLRNRWLYFAPAALLAK
jgi:hypothetical protein